MNGVVKWYVNSKGFGFLSAEDGTEYFVRQENIEIDGFKGLEKGASVIFELARDEDGKLEATRVKPVPLEPDSAGRTAWPDEKSSTAESVAEP